MKTIEQMFDEKQKGIKEAYKSRGKTEISIGFRWSVNVAEGFLPEKLKGTAKGFKQLKKWQEKFEEWDREYMDAEKSGEEKTEKVVEKKEPSLRKSNRGWEAKSDVESEQKKEINYNEEEKEQL